jgi:hypothetical protein
MSGPAFGGYQASGWYDWGKDDRNRIRWSYARRFADTTDVAISVGDGNAADIAKIEMESHGLAYERVVWGNTTSLHLALGLGGALHQFDEDVTTFYNLSFAPMYAQTRLPLGDFALVAGGGFMTFFEFEITDFNGLEVEIPRDVKEWTMWYSVGFEYTVF